ncbi:hypothetical protein TNCV_3890601 [Trichonephila clavipes]|nr:hypothetical protein TNCV_3890601 [Trichonephila clavipes]
MLTAVPLGLGSDPGEDMDVCKCIMPSRHGGTLNSRKSSREVGRKGRERAVPADSALRKQRHRGQRLKNHGEKDEKKDRYLKSFPLGEAGGRERPNEDETRVTPRGREWKFAGGGLTAPKRIRGAPKTQWEGECCFFL